MPECIPHRRIVLSAGWAGLSTTTALLAWSLFVTRGESPGFAAETPTWLECLLWRAHVPTWVLCCLFIMLWLVAHLLLRGHRTRAASTALGLTMLLFAMAAFVVILLPQHMLNVLGERIIDPLGHCEGWPVSVFEQDFGGGIGSWLVSVTVCVVAWRVGYLLGTNTPNIQPAAAWAALLAIGWLGLSVAAQSVDSFVPGELMQRLRPWSWWSALAGLFLAWGLNESHDGESARGRERAAAGTGP